MKRKNITAAIIFCITAISSPAQALESIASITQFEGNLETCLKDKKEPIDCVNTLIKKHHEQGQSHAAQIENLTNIIKQWMGNEAVVALHLVKSTDFGSVIFRRIYLIEDSAGKLMMANITYQKTIGILQLRDVQFTNQSESLNKLFENDY